MVGVGGVQAADDNHRWQGNGIYGGESMPCMQVIALRRPAIACRLHSPNIDLLRSSLSFEFETLASGTHMRWEARFLGFSEKPPNRPSISYQN